MRLLFLVAFQVLRLAAASQAVAEQIYCSRIFGMINYLERHLYRQHGLDLGQPVVEAFQAEMTAQIIDALADSGLLAKCSLPADGHAIAQCFTKNSALAVASTGDLRGRLDAWTAFQKANAFLEAGAFAAVKQDCMAVVRLVLQQAASSTQSCSALAAVNIDAMLYFLAAFAAAMLLATLVVGRFRSKPARHPKAK